MRKVRLGAMLLLLSLVLVSCAGGGNTYLYDAGEHTHVYGNPYDVSPVTCVDEGSEIRYCKICHVSLTRTVTVPEAIEDRIHTFSDTVITPTECEEGYTKRSCTLCTYVIERANVVPALYALLTNADTSTAPPAGVTGAVMSDTNTHMLTLDVGRDGAVSAEIARRLAVALVIAEEANRTDSALKPDDSIPLVSGDGKGNSYTVRELLYEWVASGDVDVARGFAAALDGENAAFAARVTARLAKLGVTALVAVDPFSPTEPGTATLGGTAILLARALDEPLLCEAFAASVPGLVRINGKKPVLYLKVGELRISALAREDGHYRFLLLQGSEMASDLENNLFLV